MNQATKTANEYVRNKSPDELRELTAKVRTDTLEEAAQAGEKMMDVRAENQGVWNTAIRQFATIIRALKQQDV